MLPSYLHETHNMGLFLGAGKQIKENEIEK